MTPKPRDPPLPKTLIELLGFLLQRTDRSKVDAGRVIEQILGTVRLLAVLLVTAMMTLLACGLGGFVLLVVRGHDLNLEPLTRLNPMITAAGGAVATVAVALLARVLRNLGIRGVGRLLRPQPRPDPPAVTSADE